MDAYEADDWLQGQDTAEDDIATERSNAKHATQED
jgi:hypothetical protein